MNDVHQSRTHLVLLPLMVLLLVFATSCFTALSKGSRAPAKSWGLPVSSKPVPVVPASEAPHPPGGPSFYCVQFQEQFQPMVSYCTRDFLKCEGEAKALRDRGKMETVTSCQKLSEVACLHEWKTDGSTRHRCFIDKEECDKHTIKAGGYEEKISECRMEK